MPLHEHQDHCPYCNEAISVWLELPDGDTDDGTPTETLERLALDQQQDCSVCCRPIYLRFESNLFSPDAGVRVELLTENDVF